MTKAYEIGDSVWSWLLRPDEYVVELVTPKTLVVSLRDRSWTRTIRLNGGILPPDWHDTERDVWLAKVAELDAKAASAAADAEKMRARAVDALGEDF